MKAPHSMSDIFQALRREEARVAHSAPDTLGPFKSRLYFNDWKSALRFLAYTLLFRTKFHFVPKAGARWILSRPGGSVRPIANSYLDGFRDIAGEIYKFSELVSRDRFMPWRVFRRLAGLTRFLATRSEIALRYRIFFGAAHARFWDDEIALQKAIGQTDCLGVITFCDQNGIENQVAQFMRRSGKRTITLQHGQYRLLEKEGMSPDIEALYNFVSDTMLCWGEATIREFEKIGVERTKFVAVGVLRQGMETERKRSIRLRQSNGVKRNAFGLVLSGDNNPDNNAELICFAKQMQVETGMACILRLHPRSNVAFYPDLSELTYTQARSKENFFEMIDIAIMSSTGFFLECFYRSCPFVFLYSRFLPEPFRLTGVVVSSPEELLATLNAYDWERLKVEIPYFYDAAAANSQRIRDILDGPV